MSTETTLVDYLENTPAVAALIGDRLYPRRMPDETELPCVVYLRVSTVPEIGLDSVHQIRSRFRFTPWADRATEVTDVAQALKDALTLVRIPPDVDRIIPEGETDRYDNDALLYGQDLDFLVFG